MRSQKISLETSFKRAVTKDQPSPRPRVIFIVRFVRENMCQAPGVSVQRGSWAAKGMGKKIIIIFYNL